MRREAIQSWRRTKRYKRTITRTAGPYRRGCSSRWDPHWHCDDNRAETGSASHHCAHARVLLSRPHNGAGVRDFKAAGAHACADWNCLPDDRRRYSRSDPPGRCFPAYPGGTTIFRLRSAPLFGDRRTANRGAQISKHVRNYYNVLRGILDLSPTWDGRVTADRLFET